MIHRALLGSMERFIGILLEHFAGEFPLWLAPVQVAVLPIAERHRGLRRGGRAELRAAGLRADVDGRDEKVGRKIRDTEQRKVPAMLVVGEPRPPSARSRCAATGAIDRVVEPLDEAVAALAAERASAGSRPSPRPPDSLTDRVRKTLRPAPRRSAPLRRVMGRTTRRAAF